jgi:hypothetical protein
MSEADLLAQVTELAELYGWQWVHFRPARTVHGWRTPVSGPLRDAGAERGALRAGASRSRD